MSVLTTKQNDLEPAVYIQLRNGDGSAIDLTTAVSVWFLMRKTSGGATLRAQCEILEAFPDFDADEEADHIRYVWRDVAGVFGLRDTATIGTYDQEVEILFASSRPMTIPKAGHNTVVIEDDLD